MAVVAMVAMAAGTALQTISAIREGQVASAGAEYNAKVAEQQAKAYQTAGDLEAQQLEAQGKVEEAKLVREKAQMQSTQRARYAKSGVLINEGSPLEVLSDTAAQYELDLSATKYNTRIGVERSRYSTAVGVARSKSESAYQNLLAKEYSTSGYVKGAGTLLTGLGTLGTLTKSGSSSKK